MTPTPFQLYNTLTRSKKPFLPKVDGEIGMYICGVTVYDDCHLGHARVMLFFDMMNKLLTQLGWRINYIRNITDIDDKIINRALANNESVDTLTERVIASMHQDSDALGMDRPTTEPRATHHMEHIIAFIEKLLTQGNAYQTEVGNVYFDVSQHDNYGALSGKKRDDLLTGVRIDVETDKRTPADFALWKAADSEPLWAVPWDNTKGRPGWHIECSAMAQSCLGDNFDIHGGGPDLVFPHHENEIAQSETANHCPFANYWMHVGSLQVDDKKMSKSLGNFITIKDALIDYPAEVIRYCIYSTHYRKPLNYTNHTLLQSKQSLTKLLEPLNACAHSTTPYTLTQNEQAHPLYQAWLSAMTDDFNTPLALSILFKLSKALRKSTDANETQQLATLLLYCAAPFGIIPKEGTLDGNGENTKAKSGRSADDGETKQTVDDGTIAKHIAARNQARQEKNWQRADEIRDQLVALGITLKDSPDGSTSWHTS